MDGATAFSGQNIHANSLRTPVRESFGFGESSKLANSEHYCFWQYYSTATSTVAALGIALYGVHADL